MEYQEGYVYHIKDDYFIIADDPNLMQNKENGNYRPTFYCISLVCDIIEISSNNYPYPPVKESYLYDNT